MEHICTWRAGLIHHCTSKSVPMDIKPLLQWLADSWRWVLIKCWLCFLPGLIRFLINFPRWLSELRCHIKVLWALDLSEGKKRLWLILRLISHHWWCITLINCSTRFTNQHFKNIMHFRSLLLYDRWTLSGQWTVNKLQYLHYISRIQLSPVVFSKFYIFFPANMGKYLIYHSEGSKYFVICAKKMSSNVVSYFNCMNYVCGYFFLMGKVVMYINKTVNYVYPIKYFFYYNYESFLMEYIAAKIKFFGGNFPSVLGK